MTDTISIHHLQFSYQSQATIAIDDLEIPRGAFTILYGPSGSGKSTLLKILAGLLPKYGGHLQAGSEISLEPGDTALLFQDPSLQFALDTPRHEAEFALENLRVPADTIPKRVTQALKTAGIAALADRPFTKLSGGEKQRAALAVVIAMQRSVILLDEPFASLDAANRQRLQSKLADLVAAGKTVIIADHDLSGYQDLHPTIVSFADPTAVARLTPDSADQLLQAAEDRPALETAPISGPADLVGQHCSLTLPNQVLLNDTAFALPNGKVTLLTGESGSGKSTFLKGLARLTPLAGEVTYRQKPLKRFSNRKWGQTVGLIFQHAADQFLNVTVAEEIALSQKKGRHPYFTPDHLQAAIERLGLAGMDERVVYSLSGGQQKKLQLLVMLMMGQPVLLLDEPFAGLDHQSVAVVCDLIDHCQAVAPATILIVSHQLTHLAGWVDHHLHLSDQQFHDQGRADYES